MITTHTQEQHANSLAAYLPSGKMFQSAMRSSTNFRKFIEGLANELVTAEGFIKSYQDQYDIRTSTLLVSEWENALGIPDDCFSGTGTIEERRRDALAKLGSLGVQTKEDFEALALLFGVNAQVFSGSGLGGFPLTFLLFSLVIVFHGSQLLFNTALLVARYSL